MANFEIWDFLSSDVVSADTTFDLGDSTMPVPQGTIPETGFKNQIIHYADDNSEEVVTYSNESVFHLTNVWPVLTESESGELFNFWHSTGIANGVSRKFRYTHPTDGHTYTNRFVSEIVRVRYPGPIKGVQAVTMRVLGRAT